MKKAYLLFLLVLASVPSFAQKPDNESLISTSDYGLFDGTYSYRSPSASPVVGEFFDKTTWNSSDYKQGHLKQLSNNRFAMNYRFLSPQGYDQNYKPGYPIMILLHGAVERGNCWNNGARDVCWFTAGGVDYKRHDTPVGIPEAEKNNLLNNDHQLLNGGSAHLAAWNRAGTKKPDDPTLHTRGFPGFILFPQMFNGWDKSSANPVDVYHIIRIVRLFLQKYNIDPNRVYIQGLSNGGMGTVRSLVEADWLFAAAAPMSAVSSNTLFRENKDVTTIPVWFFQGGKDDNPLPTVTERTLSFFRENGGVAKYTLYPNLGHGVWSTAYNEPDFFSWFLTKNKSDIHVEYGLPRICSTVPGDTVKLSLPREMWAFQWEKDGQIINGATGNIFYATQPGIYRARFSRVQNPSETQWNQWSKPVEIGLSAPATPVVTNTRSLHLPDLNTVTNTSLIGPTGAYAYKWYRDNVQATAFTASTTGNISRVPSGPVTTEMTLKVTDIDKCPSLASNAKTIWFSNRPAPSNISRPTGFTGTLNGPVDVLLKWNDVTNLERGYEIWRSDSVTANSNTWTLVTITDEDVVLYNDRNLKPGTTYYYKIRAVSNIGKSDYAPGASKTIEAENLKVKTKSDSAIPTAPQNLKAEVYDTDIKTKKVTVKLSWDASIDDYGVKQYQIYYAGKTIPTGSSATSVTIDSLTINQNYDFTVKAVDNSNNVSPSSNQVNINTRVDGLYYVHSTEFYTDLTNIPETKWSDREFFGKVQDLLIDSATQDSYFVMTFYGYLSISQPGEYKFRVHHNDGTRVSINNQVLIYHNQYVQQGCPVTGMNQGVTSLNLAAGFYPIEVRYWQSEDDRCLKLEWQGPDAGADASEWYQVPTARYTSNFGFAPPTLPIAPENLAAAANGMEEINLSWNFNGFPPVQFEVYRSLTGTGPWTMVNTVSGLSFTDTNLTPDTEYFYRLRTVNSNGGSATYSNVASARTEDDDVPPTAPTHLTPFSSTLTSVSFGWTSSTDNVGVTGYEIWINGVYHSSATQNFAVVSGLAPQTTPSIYVIAFDANNNKSQPSNTINVQLSGTITFYTKLDNTSLTATTAWGRNADGSGTAPENFSVNGYHYRITRADASATAWNVSGTVSRIIVPANVSFIAESVQGNLELHDNAIVTITGNTQPSILLASQNSTVKYASTNTQQVQATSYGNLELRGSGTKVFAGGTTIVHGDLKLDGGVAIAGANNNGSTIILYGNLIVENGVPLVSVPNSSVTLDLRRNGTQNITLEGQLDLFQLKGSPTTVIHLSNAVGGTLSLGSSNGGGLSLASGAALNLQANTLKIVNAGTINGSGESGRILATHATIDVSSTSSTHSNIHVDAIQKTFSNLNINLTGSGDLIVQSPLNVVDGIKIKAGDLNSNGNITMMSTASKTANLHQIESNGRVVGNVHVQRFFNVKRNLYRYISAPVEGVRVMDWQMFFAISGDFNGYTGGTTSPSLYTRDLNGDWVGYPDRDYQAPYNTRLAPIERGNGYAAYIRNSAAFTMTSSGVPFQGTIPFPLHAASADFDGWNLIGNPYASTIQWNDDPQAWINKVNVSNIIAVRNNSSTGNQFMYYDAVTKLGTSDGLGTGSGNTLLNGKIAPGQAFYVLTTSTIPNQSPTLSITEAAKFNDQQSFYRDENESGVSHLFLNLKKGDITDQAIVTFTDLATDSYDQNFDASKLKNEGMFNFATLTQNDRVVAINNMSNSFCDKRIKLSLQDMEEGEYVLEIPSPESLYGITNLQLLDKFLGTTVAIAEATSYSFAVTADVASSGNDRFELVMNRPEVTTDISVNSALSCDQAASVLLSTSQKGAAYSVINTSGVEVISSVTGTGAALELSIPTSLLVEGVNEFKVKAFFSGCSATMLSETVSVVHYNSPVLHIEDLSVCSGSPALVNVTNSNFGVVSYNWYNGDNSKIKGVTSATFETEPVMEERIYQVAAVLGNGCESKRSAFVIYPEELTEPELTFANDTLFVTASAIKYQWTKNGEVLQNKEGFLTNLSPGSYEVTCTKGGCSKTSRVFSVTGVEENVEALLTTVVFPNPGSSSDINLKVTARSSEDVIVKVIDVLGKEHYFNVFRAADVKQSVKINPENGLRSGVYYMIVKQGKLAKEVKFIVK